MKNVIDRAGLFSGSNTERRALVFNFRCTETAVAGGVLLPGDTQRPVARFISMPAGTGRAQMGVMCWGARRWGARRWGARRWATCHWLGCTPLGCMPLGCTLLGCALLGRMYVLLLLGTCRSWAWGNPERSNGNNYFPCPSRNPRNTPFFSRWKGQNSRQLYFSGDPSTSGIFVFRSALPALYAPSACSRPGLGEP